MPDTKSITLQEMERRANDLLRVHNPTNTDYVIEWDRVNGTKLFRVPAKGEAVFVRYIAEKYIREMFDKIFSERAQREIIAENQKRIAKGIAEMDKTQRTGEQMHFESKFYHPTNEEAKQVLSLLYLGVENEYGVDRLMPTTEADNDSVSTFDKALSEVKQEKVKPASPPLPERLEDAKVEDGIEEKKSQAVKGVAK